MSALRKPEPDVAVVTAAESKTAAQVLSFLDAHEARHGTLPSPRCFLSGADEHDRIELTEQMYQMLRGIADALSKGRSVSVLAREQEISTQQAAEVLGLSRPTVVKLIDQGELDASIPGKNRRKLKLKDVLRYRDELKTRRSDFIAESAVAYGDVDEDRVSELLDQAKKAQ